MQTTIPRPEGRGRMMAPSKSRDLAPFLKTLRRILDVEDATIMRWTPDGRAFEIHHMENMMTQVLPKYFKHRKYTSFQRQLNYFNFRKWTKSKASVCTFSNEFFQRDRPELAYRITRKKSLHSSKATANAPNVSSASPIVHPETPVERLQNGYRSWKDPELSISIPFNLSQSQLTLPSPTEVDVLFHEPSVIDFSRAVSYPVMYNFHGHSSDSLDWVDQIMPESLTSCPYDEVFVNDNSVSNPQVFRPPQFDFPMLQL